MRNILKQIPEIAGNLINCKVHARVNEVVPQTFFQ